jgi:hypothetical protein
MESGFSEMNLDSENEPTLFHYTSANGLIGIIQNRELWATESNYLNDSSEVSFASTALVALLKERVERGATGDELRTAQNAIAFLERSYIDPNTLHQYFEDRAFITSFSRSDQSLTLWRMYGGRNGFSIGFDEERLVDWIGHNYPSPDDRVDASVEDGERLDALEANYHLEARIQEVSYGAAQVESILDDVMRMSLEDARPHVQESRLREILKRLSGIKHEAFADEREARLVLQTQGHHAANPSIRVSASGAMVAYRKLVFPFEAVRSITIAPGANVSQTRHAIGSLLTRGGRGPWGHVDVRACDVPFVL